MALRNLKETAGYNYVAIKRINPKALQISQLYGEFDQETKNWNDGILSNIMRTFAENAEEAVRKWIVFDGPVDPGKPFAI